MSRGDPGSGEGSVALGRPTAEEVAPAEPDHVDDDEQAVGAAPERGTARSGEAWWVRAWHAVHRHPILAVAAFALVIGIIQMVWIWNHRLLGALDPDESGYIATAFRYHRILVSDPLALPRAIGGTGNGPLIPLLSVPLLIIGPQDPRTVLFMQPILMGITAVAVAGIARRLAGSGAALVSGCVFMLLPTVVFASQTYWLGLGAAAFMALGMWALLESDRLTNRWSYAYGACVGAMLLCRTMTLGFLPAMVVAGVIVAGWNRRSWIGLAKGMGAMVVVALPWWFVAREPIFDYLFSYGYGERAGLFGDGGPPERLRKRIDAVLLGVGVGDWWLRIVLVCSAFVAWRTWDGWPKATREGLAVAAAAVLGLSALISTSNNGVWFELPIIALLVPLGVALGAKAPVIVRGVTLVPVLVVGALTLACATWIIAPGDDKVPGVTTVHRVAQYEYGFEQYDERFGPSRRDELAAASADWWDLSTSVERDLRERTPDGQLVVTMSGNFQMFNSNSVGLAAEQRGWTPRLWIPDTVGTTEDRAVWLTPTATDDAGNTVLDPQGDPVERVLLIARHDQHLFTPDEQVDQFYEEAVDAGWEVERSFPIPVGGEVVLMRHPDAPR